MPKKKSNENKTKPREESVLAFIDGLDSARRKADAKPAFTLIS